MELVNKQWPTLQERIEQFIGEGFNSGRFTLERAAHLHYQLIGSKAPLIHVGYVRFLRSTGLGEPQMDDLCSYLIGQYWEFLIQHHGCLASREGMRALRALWKWATQNEYILPGPMPADLRNARVLKPYRVKIIITETK